MMDIEAMLELGAGEELDVIVAKLLGENVQHAADFAADDKFFGGKMFCSDREWYDVWIWDARTHTGHPIPPYSTDANAALELVSEMVNDFRLELTDEGWKAYVEIWSNDKSPYARFADTPALAIVRAWLAYRKADTP